MNSPSHMWKPPSRSSSINSIASTYSQVSVHSAVFIYSDPKHLFLAQPQTYFYLKSKRLVTTGQEVPLEGNNPFKKHLKQSHLQ